MNKLKNTDISTKILLIVLVVVISFVLLFFILSEFLVQDNTSFDNMMESMMDHNNPDYTVPILLSLTIALVVGVLATLLLKPAKTEPVENKTDELEILKRALSDDEKAVLDEIRRAGEITQDSLRFRLEWSKAKLSRILTNLDKLNIIQRERVGKTYNVFITGERPDK